LSAAALAAAEAPVSAASDMLAALELAEKAAQRVKANIASDVLGGSDLLGGALSAVLRNVDINLPSIADERQRERLRGLREELAHKATQSLERVTRRTSTPSV
jgi:methenyltetrahydrofolate cyclohydrolase